MMEAVVHAVYTLKDAWAVKLAASFLLSVFASREGSILLIFFALVFIDLFTRWIALTRRFLDDIGAEHRGLWACLTCMMAARAAGYIQSAPMKHRFAGKFLWYMLMCGVALLLDRNFQAFGDAGGFVKLFVIYMGISEAMSVLENLQEAGVEQAGGLLDLIKARRKGLG